MRTATIDEVNGEFIRFPTVDEAGKAPYGAPLYDSTERAMLARVVAEPTDARKDPERPGVTWWLYKVEFKEPLAAGDEVRFH